MGKRHARLRAPLDFQDLPELPVEAIDPAMKRMRTVICGELHHLAFEHETRIGNAIGIATDGRAEELPIVEIVIKLVMPEHDVVAATLRVRHYQRLERSAIGYDTCLEAVCCAEDHALDGAAVRQHAEHIPCNICRCINHDQSSKASTIRCRPSMKASATRRSGVRSTSLVPVAVSSTKRP